VMALMGRHQRYDFLFFSPSQLRISWAVVPFVLTIAIVCKLGSDDGLLRQSKNEAISSANPGLGGNC